MKKVLVTLMGALLLLAGPKTFGQISNIDGVWSFGGGFSMMSLSASAGILFRSDFGLSVLIN